MPDLPMIMVAPNGGRRQPQDHPRLPLTIEQITTTAKACFDAGARGIHAHVRDANHRHSLDSGLYLELLAELAEKVPDMQIQITSESLGYYTPADQREMIAKVRPANVSIALREMIADGNETLLANFYHGLADDGIMVQHILYDVSEFANLNAAITENIIPRTSLKLLFVLGQYGQKTASAPSDLNPFLARFTASGLSADWAVCAFGVRETACLEHAIALGGKARIGFENNLQNRDGTIAKDNAERVRELVAGRGQ